jgi:hypothetical protein
MPAKSKAFMQLHEGVAHGSITGSGVPKSVANEFVHKTPAKKRKKFAKNLMNTR